MRACCGPAGQAEVTTRSHTRVPSRGFSFSCACGSVPARDCVRALNVRAFVREVAVLVLGGGGSIALVL